MTSDEYARLKHIVAGALSQAAADRTRYLTEQCGADTRLRAEAHSLLLAAVRAEALYEAPALTVNGAAISLDCLESEAEEAFEGTARYVVRRRLGAGGMGIVYEADDRDRGQLIALKTLRSRSGDDIYQLKREFRNLADVVHPNLVSLYDLVIDDRQCFFTMDLVEGMNVVDYIRQKEAAEQHARARAALVQLVEGVMELHRRGLLHRDIKPSNVLVTSVGCVVILDFGLTSARLRAGLVGTPAYLSPEQCLGGEVSSASDWYSVGATLFHALSGRPPFEGSIREVLERKTTQSAPAIVDLAPDVPPDIAGVCECLLRRDPAARLSGQQILDRLSHDRGSRTEPVSRVFVGRESARKTLSEALTAARAGRSGSVIVHGPSGIGKSALVPSFIDDASQRDDVLVLRGRCRAHESIPYKGIDGIVDDLVRHLTTLPAAELAAIRPADAAWLVRLFPVLKALGIEPGSDTVGVDPVRTWARAFSAFRDLVARLAARHLIVIDIDDFHWADADSVKWLNALLRPPTLPSLLVIISFRNEELDAKPFLRALIERIDIGERRLLPLPSLSGDEVAQLMDALLPGSFSTVRSPLAEVVSNTGGNPFLIEAIARDAALGFRNGARATLDEMLARRMESLPRDAKVFLETLAICGRPVVPRRIFEACRLGGDAQPLVARLKAEHLIRSSRSADRVELYHDRIRETIAAWISPGAARHLHQSMAGALVAAGDDDPEGLFEHYRASGRHEQAAAQAAIAAEQAAAVLAFDLAATFYRHALALQPDASLRARWNAGLAGALENAGRPAEAADRYLEAAKHSTGADQIEWQRKAAELLLVGGQIDRGLAVSAEVLARVGMRLDRGPRSAVVSLALRRLQLRWRGLEFEHRDPATIAPEDLIRIDASWSISAGLAMVDPIRAAAFNVRQLLKALEVGDPERVARALALEAGFSVVSLGAGRDRAGEFGRKAEALAGDSDRPYVAALILVWKGISAFLTGQWQESADACGKAAVTLRDDCTGVLWELNLAHNFFLGALLSQGEIREVARYLPGLIETSRERGNFYLELELRTRMVLVWLAADDPDTVEKMADEGLARWSHQGFQRQHYNHLLTRVQVELYRGHANAAWQLMAAHEKRLRRSLLLRVQHTRIEAANYHSRCALAMAAAGEDPHRMRAVALRDAERIAREDMPWSNPFARIIWASVAYQEGRNDKAVTELSNAVSAFEAAGMRLYAAACRRRLGALVGGTQGQEELQAADRWMASQDIRDPVAMTRLIAPGFGGVSRH